jgi:Putative peptidoglycan binding domain/Protein of unknown function (DUF1236)
MNNSKLMVAVATAALIAGTSAVFAQQPGGGAPAGQMAPRSPGGGQATGQPTGLGAVHNGAAETKGGKNAAEGGEEAKPNRTGEAQPNRNRETTGQAPQNGRQENREGNKATGQQGNAQNKGQEHENQRQGQAQQDLKHENQRQGEAQQSRRQQGNVENQGQERENQRQGQAQQGQQGTVNLTSEQRTKIRQDIFSGSNVPRVENANFALRVGTVVPNEVRIVEVPETLIAIHPDWRGDQYFVMRDDVIIVDHEHRIMAVMPVSPSAAQREGGSQSGHLSLSLGEIREIQMKLNQKGFDVGQADGVMGSKTKDGLAQFQRQQGLRESGDIDSETADALGVSNAPSTTGSAPRSR